ncbi:ABC-type transport auxiliary lipoprotein family protein [Tepidicaulis sp.]|uniref:ABC-type transport auxiliary lipoprotein family protein n=1 Tax=Tepidicaulis sp. TaxID=1920809 RepID=UPI003B5AAE7F
MMTMTGGFNRIAALCAAGLLMLALGGCAVLSAADSEPPSIFVLTAAKPAMPQEEPTRAQIVVAEPFSPAAYDTNRIVYLPTPNEVSYFADARWTDRAPRMVQSLTVASLDNTGKFLAVGRKGAGLKPDYELRLELRAFGVENESGAGKNVHIVLNARLIDYPNDRIVASRSFEAVRPTNETRVEALVLEFDNGLTGIMGELAQWTHDAVDAHEEEKAERR